MGKPVLLVVVGQTSTAVLLTIESASSLENYILSMFYVNHPMALFFQIQFIRVIFTLHARNKIKASIKNRRKNSAVKRKHHDNPEPQKEYKKKIYKENPELK